MSVIELADSEVAERFERALGDEFDLPSVEDLETVAQGLARSPPRSCWCGRTPGPRAWPRRYGSPTGKCSSWSAFHGTASNEPSPHWPRSREESHAAPAADRVGQLTALSVLKARGLLTDEEFAAEKARVLGA